MVFKMWTPPAQKTKAEMSNDDEVFEQKPEKKERKPFEKDDSLYPHNQSTSIESVSDHFHHLFDQLENYMKSGSELDCVFIRRQMQIMKSGMIRINEMFEDVLDTGSRLEKFLADRQTAE